MKSFRKILLATPRLQDELASRGYLFDTNELVDDPNHCLFSRQLGNGLVISLMFSTWEADACRIGIMVGSREVSKICHTLGLFLSHPDSGRPPERPEFVLAVELLWLRWNSDPNSARQYKSDYKFHSERGSGRILEDLDTVGENYINKISSPVALADHLVTLKDYNCRISWGGRPRSSNPYIFASILNCSAAEYDKATAALEHGVREYNTPKPRPHWQDLRLIEFQVRCEKIRDYIHTTTGAPHSDDDLGKH